MVETDIDRAGKQTTGDDAFASSVKRLSSPNDELRASAQGKVERVLESSAKGVPGFEAVTAWLNCVCPEVFPSKDSSTTLGGIVELELCA